MESQTDVTYIIMLDLYTMKS